MSIATEYLRKAIDALLAEREVLDRQLEVISQALGELERPADDRSGHEGPAGAGYEPPPDVEPEPLPDAGAEPDPPGPPGPSD